MYVGQTDEVKRKLNTVRMKCYQSIIRESIYMVRHKTICDRLELPTTDMAMKQASAKFMHRIVTSKTPVQIFKKFQIRRKPRGVTKLRPITNPRTARLERTLFHSSINNYNLIPEAIRSLEYKHFKTKIKSCKFDAG